MTKEVIFDQNGHGVNSGFTIVYNYTYEKPHEFTGATSEFISIGGGIPGDSTLVVPPAFKQGFTRIFNPTTGKWEYAEDHRGESYYSTVTGEPVKIDFIGELPPNLTTLPPPPYSIWDSVNKKWIADPIKEEHAVKDEIERLIGVVKRKTAILIGKIPENTELTYQWSEAIGWKNNPLYPTPMLSAIANKTGIPLKQLVDDTIDKITKSSTIRGEIIADEMIFVDKIKKSTKMEQLKEIAEEVDEWEARELEKVKKLK